MLDIDPLSKQDKEAISRIIGRVDWLSEVAVLVTQKVLGGLFRMNLPPAPPLTPGKN